MFDKVHILCVQCDDANNVPECLYDGGDCCTKSCQPTFDLLLQESNMCAEEEDINCKDPSSLDFSGKSLDAAVAPVAVRLNHPHDTALSAK